MSTKKKTKNNFMPKEDLYYWYRQYILAKRNARLNLRVPSLVSVKLQQYSEKKKKQGQSTHTVNDIVLLAIFEYFKSEGLDVESLSL